MGRTAATADDDNENSSSYAPDNVYVNSYLPTHVAATAARLRTPLAPGPSTYTPFAPDIHSDIDDSDDNSSEEVNEEDSEGGGPGYTLLPPQTLWTPTEKAHLFALLPSHSRQRPDLLSAALRTKTTAEVQAYLTLLDSSLSAHALPPRVRTAIPQAHEAPDVLIEYEEAQAEKCGGAVEEALGEERIARERRAEEAEWREAQRSAHRQDGARAVGERDREHEAATLAAYRATRAPAHAAADALRSMDAPALAALGRLIRRANADATSSTEPLRASTPAIRETSLARGVQGGEKEGDGGGNDTGVGEGQGALGAEGEEEAEDDVTMSPASKRRLRKRLWMRRARAERTGQPADERSGLITRGRKPRGVVPVPAAESDDDDEGGEGKDVAMDGAEAEQGAGGAERDEGGDEEMDGSKAKGKGSTKYQRRVALGKDARGLTKTYRIERTLLDAGLDAAALREQRVSGLLSYEGLARLMPVYAVGADPAPERLSFDFLRYLESLVRAYARRAVGAALRVRELDFALKSHTKSWRLGKRRMVLKHHVAHALTLLPDAPRYTKNEHFEALEARVRRSSHSGGGDDESERVGGGDGDERRDTERDDEEEEADDEEDGEEEEREEVREKRNGTVWTIEADQHVASGTPARIFARAYVSTAHFPGTSSAHVLGATSAEQQSDSDSDDDDIASSDSEALADELADEARIDAADARATSKANTRVLRALGLVVKRKRLRGPDGDRAEFYPQKRARRGVAPEVLVDADPDGVNIKSAAFVESDEDEDEKEYEDKGEDEDEEM